MQAQKRAASSQQVATNRPKLIVGIVIDQFRYDYLTRFVDLFGPGGFKRLMNEGAFFENANYIHVPTFTAPGHATFMTGSIPSLDGVVGNTWYERSAGKVVTSVSDDKVKPLGGTTPALAASPRRLIGSTVGDELKLSNAKQSKVVGISMKDRAAILPSGHMANGAYWFDTGTGAFVSSTYYFDDLPEWVKKFNANHLADEYFGRKWEKMRPEADYRRSGLDDSPYERVATGNKFPHTINGGSDKLSPKFYNNLLTSPFANEFEVAFAKAAIEGENLGKGTFTDMLTLSFSANDYVGHGFGPYSHEAEDMTLRTDIVIADFLKYLDQRYGDGNYWVILTADHGAGPIPEQAEADGLGSGRTVGKTITDTITKALNQKFGEEKWIASYEEGNLYLDYGVIGKRNLSLASVVQVAAEAARAIPGVAFCYTGDQLTNGTFREGSIAQHVANGYMAERNGDLVLIPKPFVLFDAQTLLASHGTPYSYDTHVPVIIYGTAFKAGHYGNPSSPADIAPTLSYALGLNAPSVSVGRVLTEALK
jgi:predicted AlkP superfamily pyrophosphatase or phosphodiesterase